MKCSFSITCCLYEEQAGTHKPSLEAHKNRLKSVTVPMAPLTCPCRCPPASGRWAHKPGPGARGAGMLDLCCPAAASHQWGEPTHQPQSDHCFPPTLQSSPVYWVPTLPGITLGRKFWIMDFSVGRLTQCKANIVTLINFSKFLCLL